MRSKRLCLCVSQNNSLENFDVAVIGAGPAGAAAALQIAREGWRVFLIDPSPTSNFRVGEGLPPAAHALLRQLGVLERFLADGHRVSYGNLSAWGSSDLRPTDFLSQLSGNGFQLDRLRFDAALRTAAHEAGANLQEGTRLEKVEAYSDSHFRLHLKSADRSCEATCRWLVDASGRRSWVAQSQGATRQVMDRLVAFYAILQTQDTTDQDGRTWIEACPDGWWYSVLLPSGKRLVSYLTDADLVERRQILSVSGFQQQLAKTEHLQALCSNHGYSIEHHPHGADASSARLNRFTGPGWVAVGDAAISFDPLSSQGISNALYTGIKAAQSIVAALNGNVKALELYATHLAAIYQAYLQNRAIFYSYETRWENNPFWHRRLYQDKDKAMIKDDVGD